MPATGFKICCLNRLSGCPIAGLPLKILNTMLSIRFDLDLAVRHQRHG